jgi:hypothetical protein
MIQMRSNTMKTCAVGAMLFGGTLGATQTASAGVVWESGNGNEQFAFAYVNDVYLSDSQFDVDLFSASAITLDPVTVSYSAATISGVSMNLSVASGPSVVGSTYASMLRSFSVTGQQDLAVSMNLTGASLLSFAILDINNETVVFETTESGSLSWTGTLSDGFYFLSWDVSHSDLGSLGAFGSNVANFTIVPAPGAAALLGLAGLAGRRRRN